MYLLQVIVEAFISVLGWFGQIVIGFWDLLGIGQWLIKGALALAIIVPLALAPFGISRREKKSVQNVVNFFVEAVGFFKK